MHVISYYFNSKTKQKNLFQIINTFNQLKHNENKILQVFTSETFLGWKIDFLFQKLVHVGGEVEISKYTSKLIL